MSDNDLHRLFHWQRVGSRREGAEGCYGWSQAHVAPRALCIDSSAFFKSCFHNLILSLSHTLSSSRGGVMGEMNYPFPLPFTYYRLCAIFHLFPYFFVGYLFKYWT